MGLSQVARNLWVGSLLDAVQAGLPEGLSTVLLASEIEVSPITDSGVEWRRIPLVQHGDEGSDHVPPRLLEDAAAWVEARLKAGKAVALLCGDGHQRSPLIAAWILYRRGGPWAASWARVLSQRPTARDAVRWLPPSVQERLRGGREWEPPRGPRQFL